MGTTDRRCENHGCPHQRICGDTSQDWPYCQKHTCFFQGCHQKRAPSSQMCIYHTPLCLIPGCGHPRTDNGLYCPSHSCADGDCNNVINGGHWCKDHRLCKMEGCGHQRAVTANEKHEDVCWQHLPTACLGPGCVNIVNGDVRLCPQHECMYPPCREQKDSAADMSRLYCTSRKFSCINYHEAHPYPSTRPDTCSSQACSQPTADLANPSTARYCVTHECAGAGCNHPSKPASHFCAVHACLYASCPSPRAADPLIVPGSQFCTSHECRAAGCCGVARPDGSYCEDAHACAVPGCPTPRGLGVSDGIARAASVCCASHTAMIARDSAAAWSFHASNEGRSMRAPPAVQTQTQAQPQRFSYFSQTEEVLGQRLRKERERLDQEARLDQELRTWHTAAAAARGAGVRDSETSGISGISGIGGIRGVGATIGTETRGRGVRRGRSGSHDSGFGGSPTVSSDLTSSNTFVS
ncbi:hypothetical protein CI238_06334 [Colletotrichum incanum]|uniref:Uncharacterized protein n=1 Tax=Colletotrichum incanum TaxID=1573173 RepID=A0A167A4K5_COLIC|nr:hypothetical protein CI238_06334 [Colletotrichum incanum]